MPGEDMLSRFDGLRTAIDARGHRAPHKPLVLLLALRRVAETSGEADRLTPYVWYRELFPNLLAEFGPTTAFRGATPAKTANPFWRLQNGGPWEVSATGDAPEPDQTGAPGDRRLIDAECMAGFDADMDTWLRRSRANIDAAANRVLHAHFPETLHQEILDAVGLELATRTVRPRDPRFRREVLDAYGHRCAVCEGHVTLSGQAIAVEAAHIKWHQAHGPDEVRNGICLCPTHHVCFDRGAWTLDDHCRLVASGRVDEFPPEHGTVVKHHGSTLRVPSRADASPAAEFIQWHRREVFRDPERTPTSQTTPHMCAPTTIGPSDYARGSDRPPHGNLNMTAGLDNERTPTTSQGAQGRKASELAACP